MVVVYDAPVGVISLSKVRISTVEPLTSGPFSTLPLTMCAVWVNCSSISSFESLHDVTVNNPAIASIVGFVNKYFMWSFFYSLHITIIAYKYNGFEANILCI